MSDGVRGVAVIPPAGYSDTAERIGEVPVSVAAELLRQARQAAGRSQHGLARLAGTPQPRVSEVERAVVDPTVRTLERLVRAAGHQLAVLPTRAATAAGAAAAVAGELEAGPGGEDRAYRAIIGFSDGLADAEPAVRVALCVAEPAPTGDRRFDAAIAGLVEHHLRANRLPLPRWVGTSDRTVDPPWIVDRDAGPDIAARTPPALRRHGVLIDAAELASV
jgi:transcriptional regulator with XRE-family HTH domain